jgi:hypothetical protein
MKPIEMLALIKGTTPQEEFLLNLAFRCDDEEDGDTSTEASPNCIHLARARRKKRRWMIVSI